MSLLTAPIFRNSYFWPEIDFTLLKTRRRSNFKVFQ